MQATAYFIHLFISVNLFKENVFLGNFLGIQTGKRSLSKRTTYKRILLKRII